MKTRRLILMVIAVIAVIAALVRGYLVFLERRLNNEPPVDGPKISAAVDAFTRDLAKRGQSLPPSVSLRQLISEGYLQPEDARQFAGAEVTISLTADESKANATLIRVRLPGDPIEVVVKRDGSIQQRRE